MVDNRDCGTCCDHCGRVMDCSNINNINNNCSRCADINSGMDAIREKARAELKIKMRYAHDNNIDLHPHRCSRCKKKGTLHDAEFLGLKDADGGKFLNIVTPDCIVAMLWVNFNGCKDFVVKEGE